MKKKCIKIALLAACLIALSGCSNIVNQFAFYPDTRNIIPTEKLPAGIEELVINTTDNVKLQAYYMENIDSDRLLIFFFCCLIDKSGQDTYIICYSYFIVLFSEYQKFAVFKNFCIL